MPLDVRLMIYGMAILGFLLSTSAILQPEHGKVSERMFGGIALLILSIAMHVSCKGIKWHRD